MEGLLSKAIWLLYRGSLLIVLTVVWVIASAQTTTVNLVPNGEFENHSTCPNSSSDIGRCADWDAIWKSPDYFHACGTGSGAVPQNFMGYQIPVSDSANIGLGVYTTIFPGGQEVVGAILHTSLVEGGKYRIRFKVSYADSANYAVCCIGVILSSTSPPIGPYSQNLSSLEFVIDETLFETSSWFQFDGVYTAQGGESKIFLGSFRPESEMNPVHVRPNGNTNYDIAYFYIDDVEVYEDTITGIDEKEGRQTSISFDPVQNILSVNSPIELQITAYDLSGRVVRTGTGSLDVSGLSGVYVAVVFDHGVPVLTEKMVFVD